MLPALQSSSAILRRDIQDNITAIGDVTSGSMSVIAMLRQLWNFNEVEQLFLCEWFLQDGPTRNESDVLLSLLLVNGLHQFYTVHAFVQYVSQHKIKRAFLTVTSKCFVSIRFCHHLMPSFFKHVYHESLYRCLVFHQQYSHEPIPSPHRPPTTPTTPVNERNRDTSTVGDEG
jgi:hypothetical protein